MVKPLIINIFMVQLRKYYLGKRSLTKHILSRHPISHLVLLLSPKEHLMILTLDNVLNQPCIIKFTVNVANAISAINLQPISPVTDVRLCGANPPLRWPAGGWPNADSTLTIKLNDSGLDGDAVAGDKIWSKEVTFTKYSPLAVEYKYGANWGQTNATGSNDNENGVGANHNITLTPTMTYGVVANVFGTMGTHPIVTDSY